ncbi:MAG: helix-turn-helix domain-containing protein [Bacteroidia bacterium]|nr:helix-turn-helix domain-containing protein [Bacteroidia bacterium]
MLTLKISEADIITARYERISHPLQRIRKRRDVIYGVSQGLEREEVAERSGVHRNSVSNYVKCYNEGGLEALTTFHYGGFESMLMSHRVKLVEYFQSHPPRSAKEDPEKQQEFLDDTLMPLIFKAQTGDCHLFFVDAAHFILTPFVGILWCFARIFPRFQTFAQNLLT